MDPVVVIMAGGAGTRFWPVSTEKKPKQFLKLFGDRSLFRMSYDRISGFVSPERVLVLTHADFVSTAKEQVPEIPDENIIGEPYRRDTAAAVTLAALICRKQFGNPVIATLTADHFIDPVVTFRKTILSAVRMAKDTDVLYTFGIKPTYPSTGYGYLERGELIADDGGIRHFTLVRFKEKPDKETAVSYCESEAFYWNSGMFVWSAETILGCLSEFLPDHVASLSKAMPYYKTDRWNHALSEAFEPLHPVSIDYGVMEKAHNVRCIKSSFSWSDVGGWLSLEDFLPGDTQSNHHRGNIVTLDAHNNLVFCENSSDTVMLLGVSDLVFVRAGSNILVTHKDRIEDIKKLVREFELNR